MNDEELIDLDMEVQVSYWTRELVRALNKGTLKDRVNLLVQYYLCRTKK